MTPQTKGPRKKTIRREQRARRREAFEWESPNGVLHAIDYRGRCATCGRSHP